MDLFHFPHRSFTLIGLLLRYLFRDIRASRKLFRPKLGASSSVVGAMGGYETDLYGLSLQGKEDDEYVAYVLYKKRTYCLNVLLHLLRDAIPPIVDNGIELIDEIDEEALVHDVRNEQGWWNLFVKFYPAEAASVTKYMRECENLSKVR